MTTRCKLSTM